MNIKTHKVTIEDFEKSFGVSEDSFSDEVKNKIQRINFNYTKLSGKKRDDILLDVIHKVNDEKLKKVGKHRLDIWEKCWKEHEETFRRSKYNEEKCVPSFIQNYPILRLNQEYVQAENKAFLQNYFSILKSYIYDQYLQEIEIFYEFGCGSGYNLLDFSRKYPKKKCCGLDWSESAVEIVKSMGVNFNMDITGRLFNFFKPDYDFKLKKNSAIFTCTALEQIGSRFKMFLDYIMDQDVKICIHLEPVSEFYDPLVLFDYLAVQYHKKRNYLNGFMTELQRLHDYNKIRLIKTKRTYFGNMYNECFNIIIWRKK